MNWPKSVDPMPTITARTRTFTPDAMTLPNTFSARKAVLPKRPKGTSTKPASVVSLNSIKVTKSCTARMKKATITTIQAISITTISTKFSKNWGNPDICEIDCRIGCPASMPVWASLPGCRKSDADRPPPAAFSPRPEKLSKTILASELKLPIRKAKKPT